jgi:hypothetical protein
MAKKKAKAAKRKPRQVEELFKGDLNSVKNAINRAAKEVQRGRNKAAAAVAKGMTAKEGSPDYKNLPYNQDSLKRADQLLAAFNKAKGIMAAECCHNTENCNFLVYSISTVAGKKR